jgi:hypothetical protein
MFGSAFVAMLIAVEQCEALRFKLLMFGIALDGPIDVHGDNNHSLFSLRSILQFVVIGLANWLRLELFRL